MRPLPVDGVFSFVHKEILRGGESVIETGMVTLLVIFGLILLFVLVLVAIGAVMSAKGGGDVEVKDRRSD